MSVALLVPCYNARRFLPRLREQVDRLRPAFDEVLLADDASRDDTAAQAEALGFTVLRLPRNLGPGGARNALAHACRSEWIHFHDVDDEIAPDYLTHLAPAMRERDVVMHFVDFIDETTRQHQLRWDFALDALRDDPVRTLLQRPMPTMSSCIRRETFLAAGGFHETRRCFEDGDLHVRLAARGARLTAVPEVLEWSLRHADGAGADQKYCFQCRLAFLEDYAATLSPRLGDAIAAEAETTAVRLLRMGDRANAQAAVNLARRLGRRVPGTAHPALRLLRSVLPPLLILGWQDRWRQRQSASR